VLLHIQKIPGAPEDIWQLQLIQPGYRAPLDWVWVMVEPPPDQVEERGGGGVVLRDNDDGDATAEVLCCSVVC
jgi:hypothetical protein